MQKITIPIFGKFLLCLFTTWGFYLPATAQFPDNSRKKNLKFSRDTIQLDTLSIVPGSFSLKSPDALSSTIPEYFMDHVNSKLLVKGTWDSLEVFYRVYPVYFPKKIKHKDLSLINDPFSKLSPAYYQPGKTGREDLFRFGGLDRSGSISRGVSFGNNQDLSVNSNLNLQLSGKLTPEINILAAISDNNIPIQPEGNTQQLQEFDNVFIQLSDKRSKLTAGDFQLSKPSGSYFMNYYKRAQGGNYSGKFQDRKKKGNFEIGSAVAISKGKFARLPVNGLEGNQGPYKLKGNESESFIIVLAGTERIFINGELLTRGQENDYIIDYNSAEITFTARKLITKDSRIIAEYQYSDKNYARSLVSLGSGWSDKRAGIFVSLYSEQDNRNQPLQQTLSPGDKILLGSIGDSLGKAYVLNIDSSGFDPSVVMYRKSDTTINDIIYKNIYIRSGDPETARYRLGFTQLGQGKGNYVSDQSLSNGRSYKWVAPVNGIMQGSYEPYILLVTPKKKQMASVYGFYNLTKSTEASYELAMSANDKNTFSPKDNGDDTDVGGLVKIKNTRWFSDSTGWKLTSEIGTEFTGRNFAPIERFREVEFERNWNRPLNVNKQEEILIPGAAISIGKRENVKAGYGILFFREGKIYKGLKNNFNLFTDTLGYKFKYNGSFLSSNLAAAGSNFYRHEAEVSKQIKKIIFGFSDLAEDNRTLAGIKKDSLSGYHFYEWQAFIKMPDSVANRYGLYYRTRNDFLPASNKFSRAYKGESIGLNMDLTKNPNREFITMITLRKLSIINEEISTLKPEQTILSRVEYTHKALKGGVISNSFVEIGSGMEQIREYSYIEVPTGQGAYTWNDYNQNGTAELDEFEIAQFPDQAKFIRVFIPGTNYIRTYTSQFNQSLLIRPIAFWNNKTGIKKLISRFSDQVAVRMDKKSAATDPVVGFDPFKNEQVDPDLASLNGSLRNTFFFNQNNPIFSMDHSYQDNRNKTLLTNGYESRANVFNEIRARYGFLRFYQLLFTGIIGDKETQSEFLSSRNYNIHYYSTEPRISWQPTTAFRTQFFVSYSEKKNKKGTEGELAVINKIGNETKYNVAKTGSLSIRTNFILIEYSGKAATPIAFEMLEGLVPGKNFTWSVSWQRNLPSGLQLSIIYDGRKSPDVKTIHTGNVQVRAVF